jgi:hypothetical protein
VDKQMKKYSIAVSLILTVFLFSGCSLLKKTDTSASSDTPTTQEESITDKGSVESSNAEYKSAIDKLKQDYMAKRDQIEQERLAQYKTSLDADDSERTKKADELLKWAQSELDTWNKEQMQIISKIYDAEKKKVTDQELSEEQEAKALQTAAANKAESEYSQKVAYEKKKILLERIKRTYDDNIKMLKDNMDKNINDSKKEITEIYLKEFEKVASTYSGADSDWEKLLKHEQEAIIKVSDEEKAKYNEAVNKLDSWLKSELSNAVR